MVKAACNPDPERESLVNNERLASFIVRRKGERQMEWGDKVSRKEEVFRDKLPSGTSGSFLCDSYKLSTHKCLEKWGGLYVLCLFAFPPVSSVFYRQGELSLSASVFPIIF